MRGSGTTRGKDGGAVGDDDDKAIGGDNNVRHLKQQSTNDGGEQMQMAVLGGEGRREVAKPPEAEVSAVKGSAAQQEPKASGING